MSNSRQPSIEVLKNIYRAIRADDHAKLESILKNNPMDLNQPISVFYNNYEPADSSFFNRLRNKTSKTLAQIAGDMGHPYCLHWLLTHGASAKSVIMDPEKLGNEEKWTKEITRLIDDKTDYRKTAGAMMGAVDSLSDADKKELAALYDKEPKVQASINGPSM